MEYTSATTCSVSLNLNRTIKKKTIIAYRQRGIFPKHS